MSRVRGGVEREKIGFTDRIGLAIVKYITSPTKLREISAAGVMYGVESVYDMRKVAREGNEWGNSYHGLTANNVGPLPDNPNIQAAFDVMGDMWEISVGQSIVRVGLHAIYQTVGKELLSEDNTFALSLFIPLILKSAHTLGLISIFGIHDHMGNPLPKMLIGQVVSSCVLMAAHYSVRNTEIRNSLGINQSQSENNGLMTLIEKGLRSIIEVKNQSSNANDRINNAVVNLAVENTDQSTG